MRRRMVAPAVLGAVLSFLLGSFPPLAPAAHAEQATAGAVRVAALTTNERTEPLGIGTAKPRLGWVLSSEQRGQRQTAYRVLVASDPELLRPGTADVWDSGLVHSAAQVDVAYAGPALRSSTRYHWSVQVLDAQGRPSPWSAPAWFETGLLQPSDWTGQWIGGAGAAPDPGDTSFGGTSWVWYPEGSGFDLPAVTRYFRAAVDLPDKPIRSAVLLATADDQITAYVDGVQVLSGTDWAAGQRADVTGRVHPGRVVLAAKATNTSAGPAGLLARLHVSFADGTAATYDTGAATWRAATAAPTGWERPDFDDFAWPAVRTLAGYGSGPWGDRVRVSVPPAPAPLLRTDFAVDGEVARARLYYSSPGYGELSLNGQRLGDSVLDPGYTRFDKRVQYVTRDVTAALRSGANVLGAVLGRGFYGLTTGNVWNHERSPWHGEPRLRAQLRVDYADGRTQTVVTDGGWRTHDSPTVKDSIYAGETYDARREIAGWDTPAVSASAWQPARVVEAPAPTVAAQENEPIKVVKTHHATAITNPKPGTYVFAFPVTLAGWARLRVTGPAGTEVKLAYGEKLRGDGTVNNDNGFVYDEHQTDHYVLRGGDEVWEPRFSYKGFTYVQVDGFPGTPTLDALEARELHTAVPSTGEFTSSKALLNQIHQMTRQSILNNLHGIPTDTPMYEKNGWMGDALMTVEPAIANVGMQRVYRKWLEDIRDSQRADGLVPIIAPTGGWGMDNAVEWAAAYPLIVWAVYQYYGDRSLLADHYPAIKRYADYLAGQANGGIHGSVLGDWLPPGHGGNPPEGPAVSATSYVALVDRTVAAMAGVLGDAQDAERYAGLADSTAAALNAQFLDAGAGTYHTDRPVGYRQTPNVLPPAFGLTPPASVEKVVDNLVADLHRKGDHLDTGILGTKYLLPLLTRHGEVELAYRIATQTTYPSWGYWAAKGSTTLWEAWDDGSRSLDHHMFGSIDQWFYEDLAGVRPTAPGYAEFAVTPHAPGDLTAASARLHTVRGEVASAWRKGADGAFDLEVTVPVGATATVSVPAANRWAVAESGKPAADAPGVTFVRHADGRAVFSVGSGTYSFRTGPQAARVGAAIEASSVLRDATAAANLTPGQRGYASARGERLADALAQSLVKTAGGDVDGAGQLVQQSLAYQADLSRWLAREEGIADADRQRVEAALAALHKALSEASAVLLGITIELTGADDPLVARSTTRLTAVVRNSGGRLARDVRLTASGPDGWTVRAGGETTTSSINPGAALSVPLDVTPPLSAPAGSAPLHMALAWTVAGGDADAGYDEFVSVRPAVTVGIPRAGAWPDEAGAPVSVAVPVSNAADVPLLGTARASASAGWTVTPDSAGVEVAAGGTATVQLTLTPTGSTVPASADVALALALHPAGRADELRLETTVRVGNLAAGRPVTAAHSLERSGWSKNLLVDGKRRSEDAAKGYTSDPPSTSRDAVEWVSVDLGAPTSLDRVVLYSRTQTPNDNGVPADGAGFPRTFQIQTSDDGSTWRTVRTVSDHAQQGTAPQAYEFDGATGRYVRMYVTVLGEPAGDDAQRGLYRLQLVEVEAYGAQTTGTE